MKEYSRILIEQYCEKYLKTKKAATLQRLVTMSYDIASQPTDYDAISLEKLIERERNPELREALEDLDDFLFGW